MYSVADKNGLRKTANKNPQITEGKHLKQRTVKPTQKTLIGSHARNQCIFMQKERKDPRFTKALKH